MTDFQRSLAASILASVFADPAGVQFILCRMADTLRHLRRNQGAAARPATLRVSRLARLWDLSGPLAGTLAALAYGDARDE